MLCVLRAHAPAPARLAREGGVIFPLAITYPVKLGAG